MKNNRITVYKYDVFTNTPNKGNPAGVVLNADNLSDKEMQEIAYRVGFNETAFVVKSDKADLRIRYFTPGHEMNLCGHGTVATLYSLKSKELINKSDNIRVETKAGILQVDLFKKDKELYVLMEQAPPIFKAFKGSIDELAYSIGIRPEDIDTSSPIVYGSTGTWTLLVPIKTLEAFSRMIPQNKLFPNVLKDMPNCSVHPFSLETTKQHTHMHSRHFSSPLSGTVEDPVTGTASGVMGGYYITYLTPEVNKLELVVEQGGEVKRDGEVGVHVTKVNNDISVSISGTAVYTEEITIEL
ncbi:PhzF family phenazine biosynthesis isomerase [Clostridium paraputrificum]|uniref:PhzF family phenazine biosynthesis isomerase n=1 Tax=Clostridium TaxID=1485 RepID=UPI003D3341B6